jgi:hypothetical protein
MRDPFYRPKDIEFNVATDGTNVPEILGEFENPEDATKYLGTNFTSINSAITVNRFMDSREKIDIRQEYTDILENLLPAYEKELSSAEQQLSDAKKKQKSAEEMYNATLSHAKQLAYEVKRGLREMNLDEKYTSRIAYKGRYYFFTYVDLKLKLCLIRDIPEHEKTEIWNQMSGNETFIDMSFGAKQSEDESK